MITAFSVEILVGELVVLLLGIYGIYAVQKYVLADKLIASEKKLRQRIASFEANYGELKGNTPSVVSGAIGDIGIDGILNELGLGMFAPIAKGFLSNPDNIKKLMPYIEKLGIKIPTGENKEEASPGEGY